MLGDSKFNSGKISDCFGIWENKRRLVIIQEKEISLQHKNIFSSFCIVLSDNEDVSAELMKVELNYVSEEDCKTSFESELGSRRMPKGLIHEMLCAGVMEGGKDTCQVTRNQFIFFL